MFVMGGRLQPPLGQAVIGGCGGGRERDTRVWQFVCRLGVVYTDVKANVVLDFIKINKMKASDRSSVTTVTP